MSKEILLTIDGLKKMEAELDFLKNIRRREVAQKIKEALSFGDLSENAEYDAAKNEQAHLEEKIIKLENVLKNATIIDDDEVDVNVVSIGSKVKVLDLEFNEEVTYTIVGSTEANPSEYKISNESPVGNALLGKAVGDTVDVDAPQGSISFKILSISK